MVSILKHQVKNSSAPAGVNDNEDETASVGQQQKRRDESPSGRSTATSSENKESKIPVKPKVTFDSENIAQLEESKRQREKNRRLYDDDFSEDDADLLDWK